MATTTEYVDERKEGRVTTQPLTVEHIRIGCTRSFGDARAALESRVQALDLDHVVPFMKKGDMAGARAELERQASPTGLTIVYTVEQGVALSVEHGSPRPSVAYGIGNLLVATSMMKHNLAAGLYAPIRVVLYGADDGTAVIEYDRPSSTFALFGDMRIDVVAKQLDMTLKNMLMDIGN
ncbi:DUF302 domain-containing protein [Bradyrhizobium jicamae]|uniref:DUF302 domain-containing protein n=1 Tax=Bradyrhizobium jicamae TaxID=280332 RepID=UPI001BACE3D6|nr:DUF302 domain-containing protein [Bradyrhizobium jicamae]MBR0939332.1 DUF302 domain-containing protein [Bradyrhizobium jicamae]